MSPIISNRRNIKLLSMRSHGRPKILVSVGLFCFAAMPRFRHFLNTKTDIENEAWRLEAQEAEAKEILDQLQPQFENPLTAKQKQCLKEKLIPLLIVALGVSISASNANEEAIGKETAPANERSKSVARS